MSYCSEVCEIGDRCDKLKLLLKAEIALKACEDITSPYGDAIAYGWSKAVDENTDAVLDCAKETLNIT